MGSASRKDTQKFTYADYLTWGEDERWELIDGVAYDMSPAPNRIHQEILGGFHLQLGNQLSGKPCKVYLPPFDVRLPFGAQRDENIGNVVQPDISVVCDPKKLDYKGCIGAPDFIIEILSPGNPQHDRIKKFDLYERAGVKEYWIVTPAGRMVEVYLLDAEGSYGRPQSYEMPAKVPVSVLKDITIDLAKVFEGIDVVVA